MVWVHCLHCGQQLEANQQIRTEGIYYCNKCKKYTDYNYLNSNFDEIQVEYMIAKAENDFLLKEAQEWNKELYAEIEKITDKYSDMSDAFFNRNVVPICDKIDQLNKDFGLYDSHKRLGKAEENIIKWFEEQIKEYCLQNNLNNEWNTIKDVFTSKFIKIDLDIRSKVLNLAEKHTSPEFSLARICGGI